MHLNGLFLLCEETSAAKFSSLCNVSIVRLLIPTFIVYISDCRFVFFRTCFRCCHRLTGMQSSITPPASSAGQSAAGGGVTSSAGRGKHTPGPRWRRRQSDDRLFPCRVAIRLDGVSLKQGNLDNFGSERQSCSWRYSNVVSVLKVELQRLNIWVVCISSMGNAVVVWQYRFTGKVYKCIHRQCSRTRTKR